MFRWWRLDEPFKSQLNSWSNNKRGNAIVSHFKHLWWFIWNDGEPRAESVSESGIGSFDAQCSASGSWEAEDTTRHGNQHDCHRIPTGPRKIKVERATTFLAAALGKGERRTSRELYDTELRLSLCDLEVCCRLSRGARSAPPGYQHTNSSGVVSLTRDAQMWRGSGSPSTLQVARELPAVAPLDRIGFSSPRSPRSRSPELFSGENYARPLASSLSPRPASPGGRLDFGPAGMSSSLWSQEGKSYTEQLVISQGGSPGQDLQRFAEGPSRYINGPPDSGTKATLRRDIERSPRGRFAHGVGSGPAYHTEQVMMRKLACLRSGAGPDPYNASMRPLSRPATSARFAAENGARRQPWILGRTATQPFDPYHVGSRNEWHHTSNTIKSILAPPMPQKPSGSVYGAGSARQRRMMRPTVGSYQPMRLLPGELQISTETASSFGRPPSLVPP